MEPLIDLINAKQLSFRAYIRAFEVWMAIFSSVFCLTAYNFSGVLSEIFLSQLDSQV